MPCLPTLSRIPIKAKASAKPGAVLTSAAGSWRHSRSRLSNLTAIGILLLLAAGWAPAADYLAFVGTYTRGPSKGIYAYHFQGGSLKPLGLAAATSNPSFLISDASGRFLYAVNEDQAGTVSAFAIDHKTGKLTLLNSVSSHGSDPCHLALDHTGAWLAIANYSSGNLAILPVEHDGRFGNTFATYQEQGSSVNKERQTGPHAHEVLFSPDNRFLLAADLGADKIFVYRFDAKKGSITPNDPPSASVPPGAGVRHLAFHPNGRMLYAANELGSSVTVFRYDAGAGALEPVQTISMLPDNFKATNTAAEIAVNAAGTVLYASNRGHDSIALFSIDPERFTLSSMGYAPTLGKTPRHFAIAPDGSFLVAENQDSDDIAVFRIDARTGELTPHGRLTQVGAPVCIVFLKQ